MFEISDRITKPGAIKFTEADRAFLATVPPTRETIKRAEVMGERLGRLLAANHSGEFARVEITSEVLYTLDELASSQVCRAFNTFSHIGYEAEWRDQVGMANVMREKSAEGATA